MATFAVSRAMREVFMESLTLVRVRGSTGREISVTRTRTRTRIPADLLPQISALCGGPWCRLSVDSSPPNYTSLSYVCRSQSPGAMPADDYTAAVSGGLKLKNVSSSSKVSKSHKKKRPKSSQPESSANANAEKSEAGADDDGGDIKVDQDDRTIDKSEQIPEDSAAISSRRAGKTEAELRHEEHRRKRVCCFHTLPPPSYLLEGSQLTMWL